MSLLRTPWLTALLLAALASGCDGFPIAGQPGHFVVTSTEDAVDARPGDGVCRTERRGCTLRAAIMESNAMPGPNTVQLAAATYRLTIKGEGGAQEGDLDILDSVRVLGRGTGSTLIDGNGTVLHDHIFEQYGERLQLLDLTLQHGGSQGVRDGGAILARSGQLVMRRVALRENQAFTSGGALRADGLTTLEDCTFDRNTVASLGGAVTVGPAGLMGIERCTFSRNTATVGGALISSGAVTMYNSTISENVGTGGTGGLANDGQMTLNNVTVTGNRSDEEESAGGVSHGSREGFLRLSNTLLANNTNSEGGGADCYGELTSLGYLLIENAGVGCSIVGDTSGIVSGDPELGPLANNGGLTETHLLSAQSPARNRGNPAAPGSSDAACLVTDQRGVARPVAGRCDLGATEQ